MVSLLIVVSLTLVGLDYRRARNAAIEETKASMRVFADRLVDRFGVLSGDTVTLVEIVASVANSLLTPPPERMDDKIAILRRGHVQVTAPSTAPMSDIPTDRSSTS